MESEVTEEEQEADNSTTFNAKQLAEGFSIIDKTLTYSESQDPKFERFTKVIAAVFTLWIITSLCRKRRKNLLNFSRVQRKQEHQKKQTFAYVEHTELVSSTTTGDYTTFKSVIFYCIIYHICYRYSVYTLFPPTPQVEECLYPFRSSSLCS